MAVTDCVFTENTATLGGGIMDDTTDSHSTVYDNTFVANTATTSASAIYNNGNMEYVVIKCPVIRLMVMVMIFTIIINMILLT